ncbi:hypothetical protein [Microvirga sp. M2]|uniref:hypothetical protein n=1 Tax=Microvirga sp. M2 TaxID=3073270 RepID=UPI0039C45085
MQTPEWLKLGLYDAACYAAELAVIGFSWGGWVTGGTARTMAADRSNANVVAALSLICVDQSKHDSQPADRVAAIKTASSWNRGNFVMKNGWAMMPGTAECDSQVAKVCADKIAA